MICILHKVRQSPCPGMPHQHNSCLTSLTDCTDKAGYPEEAKIMLLSRNTYNRDSMTSVAFNLDICNFLLVRIVSRSIRGDCSELVEVKYIKFHYEKHMATVFVALLSPVSCQFKYNRKTFS